VKITGGKITVKNYLSYLDSKYSNLYGY